MVSIKEECKSISIDEFRHCTIIHSPPKPLEGYTILYKAFASTLPLDPTSLFLDDGNLNISTLASPRGGEFNGLHSAVYLTPQRQIADLFRQYISLRCPVSSTYLLCFSIPDAFLATERGHIETSL
jgi:hypothetical protein